MRRGPGFDNYEFPVMRLRSRTSDVVAAGFEVASPTFLDVVNTLRTVQSGFVTDGLKCVPVLGVAVFRRFSRARLDRHPRCPPATLRGSVSEEAY